MEERRSSSDQDWLNLLSGQFLLIVTFMLNLLTTFGAIWTIFRLGLNGNDLQAKLFTINSDPSLGELISFQTDLAATSLLAKDRLNVDELSSETISFVASDDSGKNRAGLSLNSDYISMQAKSYGPRTTMRDQYSFRIDRELEKLSIMGPIHNVRSLRSNGNDLNILSQEQLELSGNQGLNAHSTDIIIESGDRISVGSKQDGIEIRTAPGGLLIPDLPIHYRPNVQSEEEDEKRGDSGLSQSASRSQLLCIRKPDGMVYKATGSCN